MRAFDYSGQVVVVTGGTRGIGAGIACAFLAAGAEVIVCGRTEPGSGGFAIPVSDGRTASFVRADVRDPDQAKALVQAAVDQCGRLDVLVNNAGGSPPADAASASPRFHAKVIELNLVAPLHVSQAAYPVLRASGGSIVMIGSVSGARPSPGTAAYGAAKAGLHHLATSLAIEWAPRVRVNTVVVGLAATENSVAHYGDQGAMAVAARAVPLGRMASPQDVADACLFLASPMAAHISGATLAVHGGGERPPLLPDRRDGMHLTLPSLVDPLRCVSHSLRPSQLIIPWPRPTPPARSRYETRASPRSTFACDHGGFAAYAVSIPP